MRECLRASWAAAATTAVVLICALPAGAQAGSLYSGPAPRPGPDLLYQPLADAPQLGNAPGGVWSGPPILVSGASAYRAGQFLYQGYLYDDHGATAVQDPNDPMTGGGGNASGGDTFSNPNGTYTYPTDARYAENAANLVELRVRPLASATALRFTLNTLYDPNLVGISVALGGTPGVAHLFPFGANVSAPAQYFLTVHGHTAALTDALTGLAIPGPPATVAIDMTRRQFEVQIPHSEWNPGTGVVRMAGGVGLWDNAHNGYLIPQATASATQPGGGLPAGAAFFDVAFRYNAQEPLPGTPGPTSGTNPAWWRDQAQGHALAAHDISSFYANIDFAKLSGSVNDDMPNQPTGVPQSGAFDRIMASHYADGQGANYATGGCGTSTGCIGALRGQLLPYAIYVPSKPMPSGGWGLTLLLHSLSANYNQFEGSHNQSQFGERNAGSIVITPSGRGADGWYYDHAGADTFEVWADAAAHYGLDPAATDIAGYSMGGYGTYKLSTQFPDLFAKAQPTVGPPGQGVWVPPTPPSPGGEQSNTNRMLASVRNVPFLIWNATSDELVPIAGPLAQANTFDSLGYRYEFDQFQLGEHLTLSLNDQYAPAAAFLSSDRVDRDPAHVTYVYNPTMDFAADGTAAGHAYWVSGLALRNPGGAAPLGQVDVRSHGFGVSDPAPTGTQRGAGVLTGGQIPALPYTYQRKSWGPTPSASRSDVLDISAVNMRTLTINAARARVDCHVALNVTTDGPLTINLVSCPGGRSYSVTLRSGRSVCRSLRRFVVHPRHPRGTRVIAVTVYLNGVRVLTRHAARQDAISRLVINLRGRPREAVRLRMRLVVAGRGGQRTITDARTYLTCRVRHTRRHSRTVGQGRGRRHSPARGHGHG